MDVIERAREMLRAGESCMTIRDELHIPQHVLSDVMMREYGRR
jgi:hypothetical protein